MSASVAEHAQNENFLMQCIAPKTYNYGSWKMLRDWNHLIFRNPVDFNESPSGTRVEFEVIGVDAIEQLLEFRPERIECYNCGSGEDPNIKMSGILLPNKKMRIKVS